MEDHYQRKSSSEQVAANASFFCNSIAMKEQVNRAYEEGSSEDEKTDPLSEVKRFLSDHSVSFFFRKAKMLLLMYKSIRKRANPHNRWRQISFSFGFLFTNHKKQAGGKEGTN